MPCILYGTRQVFQQENRKSTQVSQNITSNPSRFILLHVFVSYLITYVEEFVCGSGEDGSVCGSAESKL